MGLCDPFRDGKPQTGAGAIWPIAPHSGLVRTVKALEDMRLCFRWNAGTIVPDDDDDAVGRLLEPQRHLPVCVARSRGSCQSSSHRWLRAGDHLWN